MNSNSIMLDYVKRQSGREDFQPEGVFPADPEEQEEFGKADQEYDGSLRLVNKPPNVLREMMASENDPKEVEAIRTALAAWDHMSPKGRGSPEAGEPGRGEPRVAVFASSIRDVARGGERVAWPSVMGAIGPDGRQTTGSPHTGGMFLGLDIIDYAALEEWQTEAPLPDEESWF
jgi:hypothetical protein